MDRCGGHIPQSFIAKEIKYYPGVDGFTGLHIWYPDVHTFYHTIIGSALHVKLSPEKPPWYEDP